MNEKFEVLQVYHAAHTFTFSLKESNYSETNIREYYCDGVSAVFLLASLNPNRTLLAQYLTPLFAGKIFYAPRTPLTDALMKEFNDTFVQLHRLFYVLDDILANVRFLRRILSQWETSMLNHMIKGASVSNESHEKIERLEEYLELLTELVGCLDKNRIVGFASEQEMEEAAFPLLDDDFYREPLWAGFTFFPNDVFLTTKSYSPEASNTLIYKIRMKTGLVPNTNKDVRDPWLPNPDVNPLKNLLALISGQTYLIDGLEKAFIRFVMHIYFF